MTLRVWFVAVGVLAVAVVLGSLTWGTIRASSQPPSVVGATAPALTLRGFDGRAFDLASLRGRPVVLNFWASWCPPCHAEQASLNTAAAKHPDVRFVGADIRDSDGAARSYLTAEHVAYPTGVPVSGYSGYRVTSPPETFFIASDGRVVAHFAGPIDSANLSLYLSRIA